LITGANVFAPKIYRSFIMDIKKINVNDGHIAKIYNVGEVVIDLNSEVLKINKNRVFLHKHDLLELLELIYEAEQNNRDYYEGFGTD
jgi:hypothetical protein